MAKKYCYLNGRIVSLGKAGIHPTDIGFLRGYGVFEFLRTYNGKPFLYKEHIERLKNSAKALNLKLNISEEELKKIINKLLLKNKFNESTIRIVLTGGKIIGGMEFNSSTLLILVDELKNLPANVFKNGIKLISFEHKRIMPEAKTLNYIPAVKLFSGEMKKQKAFEVLYMYNNRVLECSTSNFFIFSAKGGSASGGKNTTLITPKKNVLIGTTRDLVVKLAKKEFKVEERDIKISELKTADEAFITATNKEIIPVVKIGAQKIGDAKPATERGNVGKNTKILMKLFRDYTEKSANK